MPIMMDENEWLMSEPMPPATARPPTALERQYSHTVMELG